MCAAGPNWSPGRTQSASSPLTCGPRAGPAGAACNRQPTTPQANLIPSKAGQEGPVQPAVPRKPDRPRTTCTQVSAATNAHWNRRMDGCRESRVGPVMPYTSVMLAGRYRLDEPIAAGAIGEVWQGAGGGAAAPAGGRSPRLRDATPTHTPA